MKYLCLSAALLLAVGLTAGRSAPQPGPIAAAPIRLTPPTPYRWDSVFIGSGGTVTVLAQHPRNPRVLYMGADVGGPFRRTADGARWVPLADRFGPGDVNLYHTECIALDAQNPDVVYYSAGKEWTSGTPDVLKSIDRGKTWTRTGLRDSDGKPVFITNGRTGKRLQVDPNDGRVLFYGSRRDGLFVSDDGAKTWRQRADFPVPGQAAKGVAVQFVQFDARSGRPGAPTPVVYAGVAPASKEAAVEAGIYRSRDGGRTWAKLPGAPEGVSLGEIDPSTGALYAAGSGGVWRFRAGAWQEITPARGKGYSAVAVSPGDPNLLAAAAGKCGWGNAVFRSADGGRTWTEFNDDDFHERGRKTSVAARIQPWEQGTNGEGPHAYACVSSLTFDKGDPKKLWMTSWPGIWSCRDFTARVPAWTAEAEGHEETCLFDVVSPPAGAPLVSGLMDVGGFRHTDLTRMPPQSLVGFTQPGNTVLEDGSDLDVCEADPDFVALAGGWKHNNKGTAGYSTDNGRTWRNFPAKPFPDAKNGRIAVSAGGPDNIVWVPRAQNNPGGKTPPYFTRDRGKTWTPSTGAPADMIYGEFVYTFYQPLESDRVRSGVFYLYDRRDGRFHRSDDGGASFAPVATLPRQQGVHYDQHTVRAAPGLAGEVWAALDDKGLFRSPDGGDTWTRLDGIERAWRFGWGRPAKAGGKPAAFLLGRIRGDAPVGPGAVAVYRSDDLGATWTRLSDPAAAGWGQASVVNGDRQTPGRVYVGTNGRGIFFGEPAVRK